MSEFLSLIRQFITELRFWVIVSPWEQALRVRFGKRVRLLNRGIHLKIPIIDTVFLQTVRLRLAALGRQTVTTRDGATITLVGAVGYAIRDVEKLYLTLHHAEDTIAHMVKSALAADVASHPREVCQPALIEKRLTKAIDLEMYGLCDVRFYITEFAIVRTYRLIGDYGAGSYGGILDTDKAHGL